MVSLCTVHHNRLLPLAATVHSGVVPVEGEGASVSIPTNGMQTVFVSRHPVHPHLQQCGEQGETDWPYYPCKSCCCVSTHNVTR